MANALNTQHLVQAGRAPGVQARNVLQVKGMAQGIEETEYQKTQRGTTEEFNALRNEALAQGNQLRANAIEETEYLKERRPFKEEAEAWEWMSKITPLLTLGNFNEFRDRAIQWGINPKLLGKLEDLTRWAEQDNDPSTTPETALEEWKLWSMEQIRLLKAQATGKGPESVKVGTSQTIFGTDEKGSYEQKQRKQKDETWKNVGGKKYVKKAEGKTIKDITAETTAREKAKLAVKDTPEAKREKIKKDFKDKIDKARSAQRSVGQFIEDENKSAVAKAYMKEAMTALKRYAEAGGDIRDLNISPVEYAKFIYKNPSEVQADVKAGDISQQEGEQILTKLWPDKFR